MHKSKKLRLISGGTNPPRCELSRKSFLDHTQIVGAQPGNFLEQAAAHPSIRRQSTRQRRRQGHRTKRYDTVGKEAVDFVVLDTPNVRVPWVINPKIIPKNNPTR